MLTGVTSAHTGVSHAVPRPGLTIDIAIFVLLVLFIDIILLLAMLSPARCDRLAASTTVHCICMVCCGGMHSGSFGCCNGSKVVKLAPKG